MEHLSRGRTEEQVEANRTNLERGRKRQPKLSPDERYAIQWPFGHRFPGHVDGPKDDPDAWNRWFLHGRDNANEFPPSMDQDKRGWSKEMRAKLEGILVHRVFHGRASIGLDELLLRLGSKADSRSERRRRACEAILNLDLFVEVLIQTGSQELPVQRKMWHDRIIRWEPGDPLGNYFVSRFHFLLEAEALVTFEEAGVFVPIFVAWENYVYSKAFAGSKGGAKSKQVDEGRQQ